MDGPRITATLATLVLLALTNPGAAQQQTTSTRAEAAITKVYSLAEITDDPQLGPWIVETMPDIIEPESWKANGATGLIRYNASSQLLVVSNTAAVHAQVEAFLKNVKHARPTAKGAGLTQIQHVTPNLQRVPETKLVDRTNGYPVPAPVAAPKHLFHFVIRYEGNFDSSLLGLLGGQSTTVPSSEIVQPSALVPLFPPIASTTPNAEESASTSAPTPTVQLIQSKPIAAPATLPTVSTSAAQTSAKPEPSSLRQVFNFIIRYEGDGIIDANVVELFKAFKEAGSRSNESATPSAKEAGSLPLPPFREEIVPELLPAPELVPSSSNTPPLPQTNLPPARSLRRIPSTAP